MDGLALTQQSGQKPRQLNFRQGLAGGIALGSILGYRRRQDHVLSAAPPTTAALACEPAQQIPTIYVHGFRGGDYTTNKMVLSAQQATNTKTFLKVFVDWRGHLKFVGSWPTGPHPLIQLVFRDKWMPTAQIVNWLKIVLPKLKKIFGFREYNAVGHSIGATAIVMAEMSHPHTAAFPRLHKLVLVAGPFDGVVAFGDWPNVNRFNRHGRPLLMNPRYCEFLRRRRFFPHDVQVLNIFGNVGDASNTDKYISVISAASVRYLLAARVRSFQEIEMWGPDAEHSKMHDNNQVLAKINRFLFDLV